MNGASAGLVVPGFVREQAEQATGSQPVGSNPPWPVHQLLPNLLVFLTITSRVSAILDCKWCW